VTKFAVAFFALVVAAYVSWRWVVRHTEVRTIDAPQVFGRPIRVSKISSRRLYFGSGHWGYGGGDSRVVLEFSLGDRTVRWEGKVDEEPRVLQVREHEAYLISQEDPWTVSLRANLNFYTLASTVDGVKWSPSEWKWFPAEVARCNLSETGNRWRAADAEGRRHLQADYTEQYVQDLLDRLFQSSEAQVK
jgi:hypothetical protein